MIEATIKDKKEEFIKYLKEKRIKGVGQSGIIPALHKAQNLFGYLPMEAMEEISVHFNVATSHIWGITTFYRYFSLKPRGKYTISVCLGTACYVKGAECILEKIKEELGIGLNETTPNKIWTLETKACLGCCGIAPVMTVNEKVYGELTAAKVSQIIKELKSKE